MNRHVTLHLVDPEGTLELAKWVVVEFNDTDPPGKLYVYANPAGRLCYTGWKADLNREQGALLGTFTWRPVKKEVAVRGLLLSDIFDELTEAFLEVGVKAVLVMNSSPSSSFPHKDTR